MDFKCITSIKGQVYCYRNGKRISKVDLNNAEKSYLDEYISKYDSLVINASSPKRKTANATSPKRKTANAASPKRKTANASSPKRKTVNDTKGKSPMVKQRKSRAKKTFLYIDHPENLDQSPTSLATELDTYGVTVIKNTWLTGHTDEYGDKFIEMIHAMPEYKETAEKYVIGGFAAMGNPSSFHNMLVRDMRQWTMHDMIPVLREYMKISKYKGPKLEQLVDRMVYRLPNIKLAGENWHRDVSKAQDGDIVFGGWINIDSEDQYFSFVSKTHYNRPSSGGFSMLTDDDKKYYANSPDRRRVTIPPGGIIIFPEHVVHEIIPVTKPYRIKRLFLGWRLTNSDTPLLDNGDSYEKQAPIKLKTGDMPAMYYDGNWRYKKQRDSLSEWSQETFVAKCLHDVTIKSGEYAGDKVIIVDRIMKGLADYGLPMYPPYTEDESKLYRPNTTWKILKPRSTSEYSNVTL